MTRVIDTLAESFGVEPVCRELGVATSTHYARRRRKRYPSPRALDDARLVGEIDAARQGYRRAYGARKTWRELHRRGEMVGRDRVARLMRQHGWEGIRKGVGRRTTVQDETAAQAARDLVGRRFVAARPDELWVADLTYLRAWGGFLYLAFILDVYGRRVVGWQIATHMRTQLVLDALEMAAGLRRPAGELVAHSDRGSQYTSIAYTDRLFELGIAPSVGSRGDAFDNAMAEAWVSTFKAELVRGRVFSSFEQAEHEALSWIAFYNRERLHESLGDIPPAEYEQNFHIAGKLMTSTTGGRYAPVEADQPASQWALAGLEPHMETR